MDLNTIEKILLVLVLFLIILYFYSMGFFDDDLKKIKEFINNRRKK